MYLFVKLGATLIQQQSFPEEVRKTHGLQGTPTRWLAEERKPRHWVGPSLKQLIASFYGTDFGRCPESFESFYSQKEGRDRNNTLSIEALKRGICSAQFIYDVSNASNLHASVMPQTKAIVSIENVVASASINQRVDLNLITKNFVDVEYHPDQFPGLVFRLKTPKTATLVFSSGKMVCTGAKSEKQSREAVQEVVRRLRKGGIPIKNDAEIVIQNMVASANLGGKVHLEEAARTLPKSMYEPEQFPGLIHRMPDPKTVILLFASGKLVCTGAKRESDVYRAVSNLHVMLEEKGLMVY